MVLLSGIWLMLASFTMAQTIQPSNDTGDITDSNSSPRFFMNATGAVQFPSFSIAPLGPYAYISRNNFVNIGFTGILVETDATNANKITSDQFNYVSCDPEDYDGGNIDVNNILTMITNQRGSVNRDKSSLVFYSTRSNHCNSSGIGSLPLISGIFTTIDPVVAAQIADRNFTADSNAIVTLSPDRSSYGGGSNSSFSHPPTTAIAMIILYSITGIITALFIVIIITGAIRAHRHPERYGPRSTPGRARQSRAKGIARAMLETIPIVKFGDHHDLPKDKNAPSQDVELANNKSPEVTESSKATDKSVAITTTTVVEAPSEATSSKANTISDAIRNADGTDDAGALGCSICTEDFQKGEEVRVLPCNHKFHPECVDPWLLNVSGTCPLCRVSLTPEGEGQDGEARTDDNMPPPLSGAPFSDRRSQAIHNLMAIAYGSREERITALRRYRAERRTRNTINEDERLSRARRFREAFRIRTRRHEPTEQEVEMRNTGIDALAGPQMRL